MSVLPTTGVRQYGPGNLGKSDRIIQFPVRHPNCVTGDLTKARGSNLPGPLFFRRGEFNKHSPLAGCVKDVSPTLTILTTNWRQLDHIT